MTQGTCIHRDGCARAVFTRRLCRPHYMAIYSTGGVAALDAAGYPKVERRRMDYVGRTCPGCGRSYDGPSRACSRVCGAKRLRSPVRVALEAGDHAGLIAAVRARCTIDAAGCWLWGGHRDRDGRPIVRLGSTTVAVHRAVLEAKCRAPLGSQHAHRVCAYSSCVNPDHLEPVTAAASVTAVLARSAYRARATELEDAIATLDPSHPLLNRAPYG
ncbi:MAG: hypothetical protein ACQEWM_12210 [Actinomycetota bacterium]